MKIAFGPVSIRPSWEWVGFDVALASSVRHDVSVFRRWEIPEASVVVFVKELPPEQVVDRLLKGGSRIVYAPVDNFEDETHVAAASSFLSSCSAVLIHCERLRPLMLLHCGRVEFVEHHNKYGIDPSLRSPRGELLWVGTRGNLRPFASWSSSNRLPTLALTDFTAMASSAFPPHVRVGKWTVRRQDSALREAAAAVDVKGHTFNQIHKSPAKAQCFVASGVPFATNEGSYSSEYLRSKGFDVCPLSDLDRLLSDDYRLEVAAFNRELGDSLTLRSVSERFMSIVESLG